MTVTEAADELLKESYRLAEGSTTAVLDVWSVADEAGVPRDRAGDAYSYLADRGLIRARGIGGYFSLAASGIDAVEGASETGVRAQRSADRWSFLKLSYEAADHSPGALLNMWDVGDRLQWERRQTSDVYEYLSEKGMVQARALGGLFSITPAALDMIERAIARPDSPTAITPPLSSLQLYIQNSFNDSTLVNAIIASPGATITAGPVTVMLNPERADALDALRRVRDHLRSSDLEPDQRSDVERHLEALDEQFRKTERSASVLQALWRSLRHLAGKALEAASIRVAVAAVERFIGL